MCVTNSQNLRKLTLAAVCTALCVVLPLAFHAIPNSGSILLPMHIPVLICGMVCGWPFGLACGLMGPVLSGILTGMPGPAYMPPMMIECGTYGLVSGLMLKWVRTGKLYPDLYIALVTAMLAGRLVSGVAKTLIFTPGLALSAWATSNFLTAMPGIVLQLVLLPALVSALMKARIIPSRYRKGGSPL